MNWWSGREQEIVDEIVDKGYAWSISMEQVDRVLKAASIVAAKRTEPDPLDPNVTTWTYHTSGNDIELNLISILLQVLKNAPAGVKPKQRALGYVIERFNEQPT